MEAQAVAVACAAASAAASGAAASQARVSLPAAGLLRSLAASVSPALSPPSSSSFFRPQAPAAAALVSPAAPVVACSRRRRCHEVAPMAALAESVAATAAAGDQRAISFVKYQGLGNDFILVDNRATSEPALTPEDAVRVCDRNFGVGGDGVIFLLPPPSASSAQYTMRIFNSDGSEPEMCGNGIRCLARFIADVEAQERKTAADRYVVSTLAGDMVLNLRPDGQVQVDMGEPRLAAAEIPTTLAPTTAEGAVVAAPLQVAGATWNVTCVSMGNPHCITFSSSQAPQGLDVASLPLATIGPQFESHPVFPARINTEFVEVISRNELKMRVWERGAGATLACGTGACALVVAAVLEGRAERSCLVHLPGGPLEIEWREADNRIYMTGPATRVFSGLVHI